MPIGPLVEFIWEQVSQSTKCAIIHRADELKDLLHTILSDAGLPRCRGVIAVNSDILFVLPQDFAKIVDCPPFIRIAISNIVQIKSEFDHPTQRPRRSAA